MPLSLKEKVVSEGRARPAPSNKNIMQATDVILNFLITTVEEVKLILIK